MTPVPERIFRSYRRLVPILEGKNLRVRKRVSARGVPHLVVNECVSVCWFGRAKAFRVFWPYPGSQDKSSMLKDLNEVAKLVETHAT